MKATEKILVFVDILLITRWKKVKKLKKREIQAMID